MTYPWPQAPLVDGTGTTPLDLQRIVGAQYSTSGILPTGGVTVSGTSSMAYKVTAGAVILKTTAGLGLLYAIEEQTVNTLPAPSTGTRQDRVVMDRNGGVYVTQGGAPGGGITLGLFTVLAGITSTMAAQQSVDRNFAIPAGASLGLLHRFHDPANNVRGNPAAMTLGNGRFALPSDRLVRFDMTHCISAMQDKDPDTESAAIRWRVYIDSVLEVAFTTRATWKNPQTNFMSFSKALSEGAHTVHYIQDQIEGAATGFMHHKGTAAAYPGNRFEVWDAGVAR